MEIEDELKQESIFFIKELNKAKELFNKQYNNKLINQKIEEEIKFIEGLVDQIVKCKKQLNNKLNKAEKEKIENKISSLLIFFFDEFENRADKLNLIIEEYIETEEYRMGS